MFVLKQADGYIDIKVQGEIKKQDYIELTQEFNQAVEGKNQVNILCEVNNITGLEHGVVTTDFKFGEKEQNKIAKMALVTDIKWLKLLMEILKPFYRDKEKVFGQDQKDAAIEWLTS
jgi:hypothetical protein